MHCAKIEQKKNKESQGKIKQMVGTMHEDFFGSLVWDLILILQLFLFAIIVVTVIFFFFFVSLFFVWIRKTG